MHLEIGIKSAKKTCFISSQKITFSGTMMFVALAKADLKQ